MSYFKAIYINAPKSTSYQPQAPLGSLPSLQRSHLPTSWIYRVLFLREGKKGEGRAGRKRKRGGYKGGGRGFAPEKISGAATANNIGNCQLNVCYCKY